MSFADAGRFAGGSILLFCSCVLSASAGVGGGGLNVPIFMAAFGYTYKQGVVYSNCTQIGNFVSQVIVNYPKHHPACKTRPLTYVEVILVLLPAQLMGSNVGLLIGKVVPDSVCYILALCVLVFACSLSYMKAMKFHHKEIE
jgi:uncharacterized membrane protein YfcA